MQRQLARWDSAGFPWSKGAAKILNSVSGTDIFRPIQQAAINLTLSGYSLFLQLPTGAGKSVCFQVPSFLEQDKVTLVISPLRSLLEDQKQNLTRMGLGEYTAFLSPGHIPHQFEETTRLIYATPELILQNPKASELIQSLIASDRLARVVLDEAHCVLEWGNTFRPSYLDFAKYRKQHLPHLPVTFLTATASLDVVNTTASLFGLDPIPLPELSSSSPIGNASSMIAIQQVFDRSNLRLNFLPKTKAVIATMERMLKQKEPAIVYVLSQKDAESVAKELGAFGIDAQPFHAGMSDAAKKRAQYLWMSGRVSTIVATVAFGMGIDRADVRHVMHHSIPLSMSAYMQQIGRAGRDGLPSTCTLFYSPGDQMRADFIGSGGDGFVDISTSNGIRDVVDMVTSSTCRRSILYEHFGYAFDRCCHNCNCGEDVIPEMEEKPATRQFVQLKQKNYDVEKLYIKLQQHGKKLGFKGRELLMSRKTIEMILLNPPHSQDELAAMRGVGEEKAAAYYSILVSHIKGKRNR